MQLKSIKYGLVLVFLLLTYSTNAQSPIGEFIDKVILPSEDTLRLDRKLGTWWLGVTGGVSFSDYIDRYQIPWNPQRPVDETNKLFSYPNSVGVGLFAGLRGEWLPPGDYWGVFLDILLWDFRHIVAETDIITDTIVTGSEKRDFRYQTRNTFTYVTISPSVRYSFPIEHFYAFAGFDLEIIAGSSAEKRTKYVHTGYIDQDFLLDYKEVKTRLGFHIGTGYDIFIADFNHKMRVFFCPYISFNGGTTILTDFDSDWKNITMRLGFTVKMERDNIEADTLYYNPDFRPEPVYVAEMMAENQVEFPGFSENNPLPAAILAYVEKPLIIEEISEKLPPIPKEFEKEPPVKVAQIVPNKVETFNFATTADVDLDPRAMAYLDKVAEFMKANPNFEVRIVGHSDNTGTFEQNQRRSQLRIESVISYLVKKGIPKGRMLPRARGAVEPMASNNTAAGRRQNRRVEISIIEK